MKKTILTEELKKEIIEYYKTHSNTDTGNFFHMHFSPRIKNMLIENNISLHTKEENNKFKQAKRKQTCLEKYNCEHIFQSEEFKTKSNKTKIQKYGRTNLGQFGTEEHKIAMLEKYGIENPANISEVKEKIKTTCLQKYGVSFPAQNEKVKEKIKQTNLDKYNTTTFLNTDSCQQARKEIMKEKYGTEYYLQSELGQEKIKQTNLQKYGVEYYSQTSEARQKARKHYILKKEELLEKQRKSRNKKYVVKDEYFDSLPELALYLYAIDHNEEIVREPIKFEYEFKGKSHFYFPDFKYKDKLVEIKGDHFFKNNKMINPFDRTQDDLYEAKYICGLNNKVEFWKKEDYNFALEYFKQNYLIENFINK